VEKNSSGTVTSTKLYLWLGNTIADERNSSNAVQKRFYPQGEQQSGTAYFYTTDHLGSVRELMSSTGSIVSRLGYDIYGKTNLISGTTLPMFQYAGYYNHSTSGLYLTKYRAFDSSTARWLSRDPIAERGGMNIYGYVRDNPIASDDSLGLDGFNFSAKPGYSNSNNTITYTSTCCHNVRFIQEVSLNGSPWKKDTGGLSATASPTGKAIPPWPDGASPPGLYPYQRPTVPYAPGGGSETMSDQPGGPQPGKGLQGAANWYAGNALNNLGLRPAYNAKFSTCAVCIDGGSIKVLDCIHFGLGFDSNGLNTVPPVPSLGADPGAPSP
jgi:RHS repeat-associated protein